MASLGIIVHVRLPGEGSTAVRVLPETTMEEILRDICERRLFKFEEHTLVLLREGLPGATQTVGLVGRGC